MISMNVCRSGSAARHAGLLLQFLENETFARLHNIYTMRTLVFATHNLHKLREVRDMLPAGEIELVGLTDLGRTDPLPETADTLEGNALQKARFVKDHYGYDCFADDTGLEVDALHGAPGVYSARYAGEACDSAANVRKLLAALTDAPNRRARFRTVIALVMDGQEHLFEGEISGRIVTEGHGAGGFGYDPIFVPDGFDRTFAELAAEEKNAISHRGRAVKRLVEFLHRG